MTKVCDSRKIKKLLEEDIFWKYACAVIFLLANAMYMYLAVQKTFHYDESYSIGMISNSFERIITITSQDVHSPFYYFALKIFCMLPGMNGLVGAKWFSWLFMLLYLIFGGRVIGKRYGRKVEFYWLLLSSFIPSMVIQSTTVRMYTMGLFFVTVASYMAYSVYEQETRKKWIAFTIFSIVAVYIHTFCMLEMVAVYAVFIISVVLKKRYKMLKKVFLSGIVVSISFLPWLFVLWKQFSRWVGWESGWHSAFEEVTLNSAITYLSEWFSSLENPQPLAVVFGVALFIYVSYFVRKYTEESKDYLPCMGMLLLGIILVIAVLVSVYLVPCFMGSYVLPLFGGVWLFGALGISQCGRYWKQLLITVFILYFGFISFQNELKLEDANGLEAYMNCVENEMDLSKDVIMSDRYFTMMLSIYYPEANYMVYGYAPAGLPYPNTETFKEWEQLEGVDTVWLISFADNPGANLNAEFEAVQSFNFDYSYYHLKLEKLVRKDS